MSERVSEWVVVVVVVVVVRDGCINLRVAVISHLSLLNFILIEANGWGRVRYGS